MPKYKLSIFNPKLNEFLYDKFSKLTSEQKSKLSASELVIFATPKNLRLFITWGALEKKLAICTKVGLAFHLIFYNNPQDFNELVGRVYKQYRMAEFRLRNIEEMVEKGIFVMSEKEAAMSLSLLAQNCHSDIYYLNRDYMKIRSAISIANSSDDMKFQNPLNPEYERSESAMYLLSKVIFEAKIVDNYIRSEGLDMTEMMCLLYLYPRQKTYTMLEAIQRALDGVYKAMSVGLSCFKLFENGYLEKLPISNRRPAYTITGKGILFVGNVIRRITSAATHA